MADNETVVGILIEARARTAAAVGAAAQDVQRLSAEIQKLKAASDGTAHSQAALGSAIVAHREAVTKMASATAAATQTQSMLRRELETSARGMASQAGAAGTLVASMGTVGLAMAATAGAVVGLATTFLTASKSIGDYQERMDIAAAQTGLTIEEIGGLTVAAANVGRSFESISPALFIFNRNIANARAGNVELLKTIDQLISKSRVNIDIYGEIGDVLKDVGAALNELPPGMERNAISFALFGRSAKEVLPIITQDLSRLEQAALRLGITLSKEAQARAREADEAWDTLGLSIKGLSNEMSLMLAGPGTAMVNWLQTVINLLRKTQEEATVINLGGIPVMIPPSKRPMAPDRIEREPGGGLSGPDTREPAGAGTAGLRLYADKAAAAAAVAAVNEQITAAETLARVHQLDVGTQIENLRKIEAQTKSLVEQELVLRRIRDLIKTPAGMEYIRGQMVGPPAPDNLMGPNAREFRQLVEPEGTFFVKELTDASGEAALSMKELEDAILSSNNAAIEAATGFRDIVQTAMQSITSRISGAMGDAVFAVISGTSSIQMSFKNLIAGILADLAQAAAAEVVGGFLKSLLGIPFQSGGTVAYAQAGGTAAPVMAQSGLVMRGIRGADTVPALVGRGETILSHELTDKLDRFLGRVAALETARATAPAPRAEMPPANVTVHLHGAVLGRDTLRTWAEDELAPMLNDVYSRGTFRKA